MNIQHPGTLWASRQRWCAVDCVLGFRGRSWYSIKHASLRKGSDLQQHGKIKTPSSRFHLLFVLILSYRLRCISRFLQVFQSLWNHVCVSLFLSTGSWGTELRSSDLLADKLYLLSQPTSHPLNILAALLEQILNKEWEQDYSCPSNKWSPWCPSLDLQRKGTIPFALELQTQSLINGVKFLG